MIWCRYNTDTEITKIPDYGISVRVPPLSECPRTACHNTYGLNANHKGPQLTTYQAFYLLGTSCILYSLFLYLLPDNCLFENMYYGMVCRTVRCLAYWCSGMRVLISCCAVARAHIRRNIIMVKMTVSRNNRDAVFGSRHFAPQAISFVAPPSSPEAEKTIKAPFSKSPLAKNY